MRRHRRHDPASSAPPFWSPPSRERRGPRPKCPTAPKHSPPTTTPGPGPISGHTSTRWSWEGRGRRNNRPVTLGQEGRFGRRRGGRGISWTARSGTLQPSLTPAGPLDPGPEPRLPSCPADVVTTIPKTRVPEVPLLAGKLSAGSAWSRDDLWQRLVTRGVGNTPQEPPTPSGSDGDMITQVTACLRLRSRWVRHAKGSPIRSACRGTSSRGSEA